MRTDVDALRSLHHFIWKVLDDDTPPLWRGEQRPWEIRLWGTEGEFGFPFARIAAITPVTYSGSAAIREALRTFAVHVYPVPMGTPEDSVIEVERVEELLTIAFECGFSYTEPLLAPLIVEGRLAVTGGSLPSGTYGYMVTSVNGTGESLSSAVEAVTVAQGGAFVALAWTPAPDARSYNVYRHDPDGLTRLMAAGVTELAWTDDGSLTSQPVEAPPVTTAALATIKAAPSRVPLYDYDGVPLDGPEAISYRRYPNDYLRVSQAPINRMTDPEDDRYWLVTVEPQLSWRRRGRVPSGDVMVESVKLGQDPS